MMILLLILLVVLVVLVELVVAARKMILCIRGTKKMGLNRIRSISER